MEYGLWPPHAAWDHCICLVLILVLMEYGLWLSGDADKGGEQQVLILVLMEYGLWRNPSWLYFFQCYRLNPCSNGIWSLTNNLLAETLHASCLNPCSNGIWSLTSEDRVGCVYQCRVLILVLMEYGLWLWVKQPSISLTDSLNPCSNGIWSLTKVNNTVSSVSHVLILVLMEYGLWPDCTMLMQKKDVMS